MYMQVPCYQLSSSLLLSQALSEALTSMSISLCSCLAEMTTKSRLAMPLCGEGLGIRLPYTIWDEANMYVWNIFVKCLCVYTQVYYTCVCDCPCPGVELQAEEVLIHSARPSGLHQDNLLPQGTCTHPITLFALPLSFVTEQQTNKSCYSTY